LPQPSVKNRAVYDVVLGRSEASLDSSLHKLEGKEKVRVICMDLSSTYRAVVQKHFPKAKIVADRFHLIRLINPQFLGCWRDLDGVGSKNEITEGFHNKMETISRQAYGFRNFENYRLRVKVLCG
jgi:transposase